MVWLRVKLLQILARPIVVPIAVGGFGLWYGSFKISYQSSNFLGNTFLGTSKISLPQSSRYIASICGVTVGLVTWYSIKFIYPNDWSFPVSTFEYKSIKDIVPLIKNSFSSIQNYPLKRLYSLVILTGFCSGIGKTTAERIFQSDSQ